jgi:transcription-repair coupling factor (superfamily II helicase)
LDNNLFNSQLDKLNFYREIELIQQSDDLNYLIDDFNIINSKHTKQTNNFFDLLRLKIYCSKYNIIKIKKTKFDYVIEFAQNNGMQNLKKLLDLDKNMMFVVKNLEKVIISIKNFTNDEKFIKYLLQLFNKKIKNNKIKLKRKNNIF